MSQPPNPESIAKRMVSLCEKLWYQGNRALQVSMDDQSPLRARSYERGRTSSGDVQNQTAEVGAARAERGGATHYTRLCRAMTDLDTAISKVNGLIDSVFITSSADEDETKRGSGYCVACGEWVPGVDEDRIKGGLCPRHYTGLGRAVRAGGNRSDYIAKVKRGLEDA